MDNRFDYIFAGSGLAALSVVSRMMDDPYFVDKKILLLDKDQKRTNDRTWCFWEKHEGYFESVVSRKWSKASVKGSEETLLLDLAPYTYKSIKGIDFYKHVLSRIDQLPNITFKQCDIHSVDGGERPIVKTSLGEFKAQIVLNSLFQVEQIRHEESIPTLYQHFKGYFIETKNSIEDGQVTFMDFSIDQKDTMQFMYVLPFTDQFCLVEHTYFSQHFVEENVYDTALKTYCDQNFGKGGWSIAEKEKGVIPMTRNKLIEDSGKNVWSIGTRGGHTKASSGYTFHFVQKEASQIKDDLMHGKRSSNSNWRFSFYDALLLRVLAADEGFGHQLFLRLFKKHKPETVFAFLNEESTLTQDLAIILKSPRWRFIKALFQELIK